MSNKIIAVVVTFNRAELLPRCLNALSSQTLALDEIIVVDNASTDTTQNMLCEKFEGRVTVLRMAQNTGGAGGFHVGIANAVDHAADWIWLMDDDGFAEPETLARLMERSDSLDVINPLVCVPGDHAQLSFGIRLNGQLTRDTQKIHASVPSDGIIREEVNPFNGTLVRADVVRKYGNIRPEMFIWGDEVEFVLRMSDNHARIGTLTTAIFNHPINQRKTVEFGPFGTLSECPPKFSHFFYRNSGFYTWKYRGVVQTFGKFGAYTLFLASKGRFRELGKFWAYYIDGWTDNFALAPSRTTLLKRLRQSL